jgi:DNA-binding response OmpR family regulator
MSKGQLAGLRVLIVEDRYLIAQEMAEALIAVGAKVVGPARNLTDAADLLADHAVDLALLDVNLDGELVFPLADVLADRNLPFVFLTGYDFDLLPPEWRDRPQLTKPVSGRVLIEELARLKLVRSS